MRGLVNLLKRLKKLIDKELLKDLEFIIYSLKNYTKRAYIVGGASRDAILNNKITDIDIEIFDIDIEIFKKLSSQIGASGVGRSFYVYKYKNIDLTLPRIESKISSGHRGFEVKPTNNEIIAVSRRDFTINSIMINIFDSTIKDYYNATNDIYNKTIKIINPISFKDDPLRVYRAMRFASVLGFSIDKNSIAIMQNMDICDLSHQRIVNEFEKMLISKYQHIGFYYFIKLQIAKKVFKLHFSCKDFVSIYKILKKADLSKYHFFYLISIKLHLNKLYFFNYIQFPNNYKKTLKYQKSKPQRITDRFLLALSLKYPISQWLGAWDINTIRKAKKLQIYNNKFNPKIDMQNILDSNLKGKDISKRIKKLQKDAIIRLSYNEQKL